MLNSVFYSLVSSGEVLVVLYTVFLSLLILTHSLWPSFRELLFAITMLLSVTLTLCMFVLFIEVPSKALEERLENSECLKSNTKNGIKYHQLVVIEKHCRGLEND